jgi:hypothetical protein
MNIEQVEGHLRAFKDQLVSICLPMRGTIHMSFYGPLTITENWNDNHSFILYAVRHWPDAEINFRAQDVKEIKPHPNDNLAAVITLNIEETAGYKLA